MNKGKPSSACFSKSQFLQSKQRTGIEKDILAVVLEEGQKYTISEAEKLVNKFKKGTVK